MDILNSVRFKQEHSVFYRVAPKDFVWNFIFASAWKVDQIQKSKCLEKNDVKVGHFSRNANNIDKLEHIHFQAMLYSTSVLFRNLQWVGPATYFLCNHLSQQITDYLQKINIVIIMQKILPKLNLLLVLCQEASTISNVKNAGRSPDANWEDLLIEKIIKTRIFENEFLVESIHSAHNKKWFYRHKKMNFYGQKLRHLCHSFHIRNLIERDISTEDSTSFLNKLTGRFF